MDALTVVLILLVLALVWLVVELVLTVRRVRPALGAAEKAVKDADELIGQAKPVLEHVDAVVTAARPSADQIAPVLQQTSTAIEALSGDLRQLDAILGDVSRISKTAGGATAAVGEAAESLATKARGLFGKARTGRAAALVPPSAAEEGEEADGAPTFDDVVEEEAPSEAAPAASAFPAVSKDEGYFTYPETRPASDAATA